MSDAGPQYPSYWVHDSQLVSLIFDAVGECEDLSWLQAVSELAFALATVLAANEEAPDVRRSVGATLGEMLRHVGLTGTIDRGPLQ